mgnify:FL=1
MQVGRRVSDPVKRRLRGSAWYDLLVTERQIAIPRPRAPRGRVVFAFPAGAGLSNQGKMTARAYMPAMSAALRAAGYDTRLALSERALDRAVSARLPTTVILVYREGGGIPAGARLDAALSRAAVVFNHPETGRIVADKARTNAVLAAAGVPMPRPVRVAGGAVFSNALSESGAPVQVLERGAALDPARYNTELIDTRFEIAGRTCHVGIRLVCVDRHVVMAKALGRDVREGSPSVHAYDAPLDAALIEALHARFVVPNTARFADLARRIAEALGPGFWAHDLLVERGSERLLLCETGFKFDTRMYWEHVAPILDDLPSYRRFADPADMARLATPALLRAIAPAAADFPADAPADDPAG